MAHYVLHYITMLLLSNDNEAIDIRKVKKFTDFVVSLKTPSPDFSEMFADSATQRGAILLIQPVLLVAIEQTAGEKRIAAAAAADAARLHDDAQ
jgi:hypothetical protein